MLAWQFVRLLMGVHSGYVTFNSVSVSCAERWRGLGNVTDDPAVLRLSNPVDRCSQGVGWSSTWLLGALQARPRAAVRARRPGTGHASYCVQLPVQMILFAYLCSSDDCYWITDWVQLVIVYVNLTETSIEIVGKFLTVVAYQRNWSTSLYVSISIQ